MKIMVHSILLLVAAVATVNCNTVYNYLTEVCCNGNRHSIPTNGVSYQCCDNQLITDNSNYTCCENTIQKVPDNVYWSCCSSGLIDTRTTSCANGNPLELPEDAKLANKTFACVASPDNIQFYDYSTQVCCDGVLSDTPSHLTLCCGTQAYDYSSSNLCCSNAGKTFVVDTGSPDSHQFGCCGDSYYNYMTQSCCENTPVDSGNLTYGLCCGKQVYDYSQSICCDGVVHPNNNDYGIVCCGSQSYNYFEDDKVCCNNTLYEKEENKLCCNEQMYDSNTQKCCYGEKEPGKGYDYYFLPIDGQIQNSSNLECCGLNLYNPEQQVCCDGQLRENPEGRKWGYCCGDEIIFDYNQSCCSNKVYQVGNQTCCNGEVYDLDENKSVCQVKEGCLVYNTKTQMCCSEGIIDLTNEDTEAGRLYCCSKYY
ncbi:hypothetical protein CHUAL_006844 [Chamberlinius hualienensis]